MQLTCCAAPVVPTATCWSKRPMTRRRSAVTRRRQVDAVASSASRRRCRCPLPPCRPRHRRRRSVLAHLTRPDAGRTPSADDEPAPACSAAPRRRLRREHDLQATTTTSGWSIDGTTTCSLPSLPIKQLPTLQTDRHPFTRQSGQAVIGKVKPFSILNEARDDGVAVASAGPYADHLHLAPDNMAYCIKLSGEDMSR